jgi:hypothetical protein
MGYFWRIFRFEVVRWLFIAIDCMKLHNLCTGRREVPSLHFVEDVREGDEWIVQDNA